MAKRIPAIEARPRGPFRVVLQENVGAGLDYWTVRDRDFAAVPVVEEWLREERQSEGKSVKTTRAYANDMKLFLTWCEEEDGRSLVGGLQKLGYFKAYLRVAPITADQANKGLPRVATSRSRILAACRSFASFAIDRGYAGKELEGLVWRPAHGGPQGTSHYRQNRQARTTEPINKFSPPKAATPDEYELVLAACLSVRDSLMVMIMALMGLRVGELCGLRWSDCHVLMTPKQMVELSAETGVACDGRDGPHVHVVDRRASAMAATAKGPDCGPVTHRRVVLARPAVVEMFSLYAREAAAGKAQLADHVFTTAVGNAMSTKAVAQQLQCIGQRAGLKRNRSPHSYRHLFGMTLGAAGVDLAHIAEFMGHASTESTRIYTRLTPKQRRDAIDKAGIFDDISWFKPTTDEE